ncbi:MAG: AbrB/MazE/SpoVT family DNA-binding domain-containing protein [Elusimicrobia bacterium]|nr:AbrB/MazE/SpoVT family DNA-binding domain-containing protein [Elusimicrobiota bacterium]
MELVEVRPKGQLTLPSRIRARFHIKEGDLMEIAESESGILLKPKKLIDAAAAWFWSEKWQAEEKEAQSDIEKGRLSGPFKSASEYKHHVRSTKK